MGRTALIAALTALAAVIVAIFAYLAWALVELAS
jgi:hypothetical protein